MNREELIEEAAKAMSAYEREQDRKRGDESQRIFGHRGAFIGEHHPTQEGRAEAALAVFEQAHTPTDDEREALARAQWDDPVNAITWDELTEKASRDEGDYREIRDYALDAAGRGIAAGFRRTGRREP